MSHSRSEALAGMAIFGWPDSMRFWNGLGLPSKAGHLFARVLWRWDGGSVICMRARGHAYVCAQARVGAE